MKTVLTEKTEDVIATDSLPLHPDVPDAPVVVVFQESIADGFDSLLEVFPHLVIHFRENRAGPAQRTIGDEIGEDLDEGVWV